MRWRCCDWRRSRRWRWTLRAAGGALVTDRSEFLLALEVFIQTNGQVLDDVILHLKAPLEFHDQIVVRRANLIVDIDTFAVLGNAIGELACAPMLGFFDLGALVAAGVFNRVLDFLDFVFRCGRTNDKNQVVQTFFHGSSFLAFHGGVNPPLQNRPPRRANATTTAKPKNRA